MGKIKKLKKKCEKGHPKSTWNFPQSPGDSGYFPPSHSILRTSQFGHACSHGGPTCWSLGQVGHRNCSVPHIPQLLCPFKVFYFFIFIFIFSISIIDVLDFF
ncbi:hypothetical protein BDV36DRAFT_251842, partial [Aspergillus pseudocaelatus]